MADFWSSDKMVTGVLTSASSCPAILVATFPRLRTAHWAYPSSSDFSGITISTDTDGPIGDMPFTLDPAFEATRELTAQEIESLFDEQRIRGLVLMPHSLTWPVR